MRNKASLDLNGNKNYKKNDQLYAPMACAIWVAIAIEAGVGHYTDVGILTFIQFVNAFIGWHETTKVRFRFSFFSFSPFSLRGRKTLDALTRHLFLSPFEKSNKSRAPTPSRRSRRA